MELAHLGQSGKLIMRPGRTIIPFLVLVLAALWPGSAWGQAASKASQLTRQFGWHTHLEGARTEARQTGKPIFLVFRCDP